MQDGEDTVSDEILAERCQEGDLASFELLFERYQRPIRAYIYQIVHNYDDASCIAQDVFLKVFEKVGSFDSSRRFSTWFYTVARNAAIDFLQSRRRRAMVSFTDLDRNQGDNTILSVAPGSSPLVDAGLIKGESVTHLRAALDELPQIFREIIELVVFQDLSYEQASEILGGVSLGTLRSRMFHALRHLRKILSEVAGDEGHDLMS
ncbi:MAG: sigma-70 family RNA polymerase sigma factor [Planctomycetota bacterium]|nr:MAG: sigma-70 family RNA polymerase sigma factor [Planctomycetota bacterium]